MISPSQAQTHPTPDVIWTFTTLFRFLPLRHIVDPCLRLSTQHKARDPIVCVLQAAGNGPVVELGDR